MVSNEPSSRDGGRDEKPYQRRVVVKLQDHVGLAPTGAGADPAGIRTRVEELYPGARVEPLITSIEPEELRKLASEAAERDSTYEPPNFASYLGIELPPGVKPEAAAEELEQWETVQLAYIEAGPVQPPGNAVADPRQLNQGYEDPAPPGTTPAAAWSVTGAGRHA